MGRPVRLEPHARQALAVIAGFVVLRLIMAAVLGLGVDESYSVGVARDLRLSYFDHPPLQYWIVHLCAPALGYGRASRLPFIALFAGSSWLIYGLSRRLFGPAAGLWAVWTLNLSAFFTVAAASWVLPDGPLMFAMLAASVCLARLGFPKPGEAPAPWRNWLAAGFWIGVAALSKYQAALFVLGVLLALLTDRSRRRLLAHPAPYAAAILCVAVVSPVLIWNAQHHWASFAFQAGRGAPQRGFHPLGPVLAVVCQAALLSPWTFVPTAWAALRATRRGPAGGGAWFCLMLASPIITVFTLAPLLARPGLPHWSMPGWLLLFPPAGQLLAEAGAVRAWPRVWRAASLAIVLGFGGLMVYDGATGWLGAAFPTVFRPRDPTAELIDWRPVRDALIRRSLIGASPASPPALIVAPQWSDAGKLDLALGDLAAVTVLSPDPREFAFLQPSRALVGRDALIIGRQTTVEGRLYDLRGYFRSVVELPPIVIGRAGHAEMTIGVAKGYDLERPYPSALAAP